MGTVMLLIGGGLIFSLIVFFICEEKSLLDAKLSDMKCLVKEEVKISECFEKYQTFRYASVYFIAIAIFTALSAQFLYLPQHFGLLEIMSYIFSVSLIGSGVILLVKWTYQPLIKLMSSFMFGSIFMGASATAFAAVYLLNP